MWHNALYAANSQPAINNLVSLLDVQGAPALTVSSLLAAVITNFGLDKAVDQAFISIIPTGKSATNLDISQRSMSPQLAQLLADILMRIMTEPYKAYFLRLAQHGQLMQNNNESLSQLEGSLAGVLSS